MNQLFREIHTPEDALYLFIFFTNHISCFSGPTLMDFSKEPSGAAATLSKLHNNSRNTVLFAEQQ